jgi:2-polyprenyl-3-methyl-5-hydroxy-6-metoxy-1,4-benzoquinol methylase
MSYNWDYLDEKAYNNKVGRYKFRRQFNFITDNANGNFDNILDIAGGSGRLAIPLCDYSNKITVIDLNQDALELLSIREQRIRLINNDFNSLEISEKFSLIICIEAIGYFDDWKMFFDKISTIITENGRFIFTYTNPLSWRFFLRRLKHLKTGSHSYNDMKLNDLKEILDKSGFEIKKMEGMNWIPFPLASNSILVTFFEYLEKTLKLDKWIRQSPWILISINKK